VANQTSAALLALSGPADIRAITAIHQRLLAAFAESVAIELDVSGIADPDISFVQLIEAARRHASVTGKTICLRGSAGGALREQLMRGGFLVRGEDRAFWLNSEEDMP
jgi:Predicted NTP binding protein (contains STAS domain)